MNPHLQTTEQRDQEKEKLLASLARVFVDSIFEIRKQRKHLKVVHNSYDKK